jgi:cell division protein FtsL
VPPKKYNRKKITVQSETENPGEVYAARATAELEPTVSSISIPRIREARDMVYNGTDTVQNRETETTDGIPLALNKKPHRRNVSPFTIILILFATALASVLYIGNILAVGRLMMQNNQLQIMHRQILNNQELLKVQINRLSSLERIQQVARDQLGLQNSKQLPVWIEIDPERVSQVEDVLQQQMEHKR